MDAIAVDGLRKRYGDVQALDGVSFSVREGEIFGLLGPNGARTMCELALIRLYAQETGHPREAQKPETLDE